MEDTSTNNPNRETARRLKRRQVYDSRKWRRLRAAYFQEHPLCEKCLEEGRITPTEQIHHIKPFLNRDGKISEYLAFCTDNLLAVCAECHQAIHHHHQQKEAAKPTIGEELADEERRKAAIARLESEQ